MDTWSPRDLTAMTVGGNGKARAFFKDHGWAASDAGGFLADRYTGRVGQLYRAHLDKAVAAALAANSSAAGGDGATAGKAGAAGGAGKASAPARLETGVAALNIVDGPDDGAPAVCISPKAAAAAGALLDAAGPPPPPAPAPAAIVQPPVRVGGMGGRPGGARRVGGGLGGARKGRGGGAVRAPGGGAGRGRGSAAASSTSTIDWSKVGSDVPADADMPALPAVNAVRSALPGARMTSGFGGMGGAAGGGAFAAGAMSGATAVAAAPQLSAAEITSRFGDSKGISSDDFRDPSDTSGGGGGGGGADVYYERDERGGIGGGPGLRGGGGMSGGDGYGGRGGYGGGSGGGGGYGGGGGFGGGGGGGGGGAMRASGSEDDLGELAGDLLRQAGAEVADLGEAATRAASSFGNYLSDVINRAQL